MILRRYGDKGRSEVSMRLKPSKDRRPWLAVGPTFLHGGHIRTISYASTSSFGTQSFPTRSRVFCSSTTLPILSPTRPLILFDAAKLYHVRTLGLPAFVNLRSISCIPCPKLQVRKTHPQFGLQATFSGFKFLLDSPIIRNHTMTATAANGGNDDTRMRTQQSPLASKRARESNTPTEENRKGKFGGFFTLGYKEGFTQWVRYQH